MQKISIGSAPSVFNDIVPVTSAETLPALLKAVMSTNHHLIVLGPLGPVPCAHSILGEVGMAGK